MKVYATIPKSNEATRMYKKGERYSDIKVKSTIDEAVKVALEAINMKLTPLRLTASSYTFDSNSPTRENDRECLLEVLDDYRNATPYFLAEFEWDGDSGTLLSIEPWETFAMIGDLFDNAYYSLKRGDGGEMFYNIQTATAVTVYELNKLYPPASDGDINE